MYIKIYPIILSKQVQRILYIHSGFNDRSLLWVVGGKVYDFLFIKIYYKTALSNKKCQ